MGMKCEEYKMTGKYFKIGGKYGVVLFTTVQKYNYKTHTQTGEPLKLMLAFDCHFFDEAQPTEWMRAEVLPIGLVYGNGAYCTERFRLHMIANDFITREIPDDAPKLSEIFNLKYE
jgi:hypothetical protein